MKRKRPPTLDDGGAKSKGSERKLPGLCRWLGKNGCDCSAVVFGDLEGRAPASASTAIAAAATAAASPKDLDLGATLSAARAIFKGEVVGTLAHRCILSERMVYQSAVGKALDQSAHLKRLGLPGGRLQPRVAIAIFLVAQRADRDAFFHPYAASLPRTEELTTPMGYSQEEMQLLRGTALGAHEARRRAFMRQTFGALFPALSAERPDVFPTEVFTWDAYVWAFQALVTRHFPVSFERRSRPRESGGWGGEGEDADANESGVLLPLIDMMNHRPTGEKDREGGTGGPTSPWQWPRSACARPLSFRFAAGKVEMVAERDVAAGEELTFRCVFSCHLFASSRLVLSCLVSSCLVSSTCARGSGKSSNSNSNSNSTMNDATTDASLMRKHNQLISGHSIVV